MQRPLFQLKQFSVSDNNCGMKIGTDALLLGAWAHFEINDRLLDVGTGSGILALMAAQKQCCELIDAIDIDVEAVVTAKENVEMSMWHNKIYVYNCALKEFANNAKGKYTHIISNPPFFQNHLKTKDKKLNTAKHNHSLSYNALVFYVASLIVQEGKFSVIIPYLSKNEFVGLCNKNSLVLSRLTEVYGRLGKKPNRVLLEFVSTTVDIVNVKYDAIVIRDSLNNYTDEYRLLLRDYMLHF